MQRLSCVFHIVARYSVIITLMVLALWIDQAWAEKTILRAARVIMSSGSVESKEAAGDTWHVIQPGTELGIGDSIRTGADGRAALLLADESIIRLNHDTLVVLQNVATRGADGTITKASSSSSAREGKRSLLGMIKGELWFLNKNPDEKVDVKTQAMTASLRGTEFDVQVEKDGTSRVTMLEGVVEVWNELGTVTLNAFEMATARPGFAPQKRILLNPENAVQWTLLVPELLHYEELFQNRSGERPVLLLHQAWEAMGQGELLRSRGLLATLTTDFPDFAPGWESLALTELVLNANTSALQAVTKAEQLAPGTPYPLMLRSLIYQARFELEPAIKAVRAALTLDANNVTAHVQLATLLFGQGATIEARAVLDQALRLAPKSAEVNNLQGFILLSLREERSAAAAFARAITADPALAEPHLGLGLIAMRQGEENLAMTEITSAVLLEPRRAMLRSYWAKMLYQLGRHDKALDVLNISRHIDPRDPTPDLYRAIIYRDLRQPGQAIAALNEAIGKNDNRAVYRSRHLLDQDLAVKNVDLSLIYNQLGLTQWAIVKAASALDEDYGNSSAHLFYARALTGMFNARAVTGGDSRSWGRGTEDLLARLLMPANVNTFNTFNDYTAFFERPSLQGEYTVWAGNNDTLVQDIRSVGALPAANLTYSLAYLPYRSAGWREDYPERSRSTIGYVKWDPAPNHGVMLSGSRTDDIKGGKFAPRYDYYDPPQPQDYQSGETHRLEFGYSYSPRPASHLLLHAAQVRNQEWIDKYTLDLESFPGYRLELWNLYALSQPYSQLQGEVIHRYGRHQFIAGSSYYRQDGISELAVVGSIDPPDFIISSKPPLSCDNHQDLWTTYIHDIWKPSPALTIELALYNEAMDQAKMLSEATRESHELSPRFGIRWQPKAEHTLHLAAFRSLLPFYADYLAPADIAGVPVQRNGFPGTLTDEANLAWDYELGGKGLISSTLFYLERNFLEPGANEASLTRDKGGSVVFNALLGEALGMVLSYRYDDIDDETDPRISRQDHLMHAGLRWLGQKGWSAGIGETNRLAILRSALRDNDNIYLTDLSVGYEFPRKLGSLKFEVNNLFDQRFNWVVDSFAMGGRAPAREVMLTLQLLY